MENQNCRGRGGQGDRGQCKGGHGRGGRGGSGRGGSNKPVSDPAGNCICPSCGHKEPHVAGQRCLDRTCPECGAKMIRDG